MSIIVSHISKNYHSQKAVDDLTFRINSAEIVGFLGPNGAGKSTTMKIITGYLKADSGNVQVCGMNVSGTDHGFKKKIGYLPESNPLYPDMYVREYLQLTAGIYQLEDIRERVERVIITVGLTTEANKKIGQLSKGYKQRVGLAAALIHDPEVLVLDEPTSGLDPNQIIEIRELIKTLGQNKTVLFSSHILQEVEAMCERVIIINNGKLVADDSLKNLQRSQSDNHIIIAAFKEDINAEQIRLIINEGETLERISAGKFQITTKEPESLKKQLMQLSLQNNWNIVSLQSERHRLEDIFRTLTAVSK